MIAALLIQMAGLVFAVYADPYVKRAHRIIMMMIMGMVLLLIAQNYADMVLSTSVSMPFVRTMVCIAGYTLRPMIIVLFFYIVKEDGDYDRAWLLNGINAALQLTALFSGVVFSISPGNTFERGPLGYSCHIISALLLIQLFYISIHSYGRLHKADIVIPVFNLLLIVGAVIADTVLGVSDSPVSFLTAAVVSCCLLYYIWLHLQFVHDYETEKQAEQRIQLMISQIQPHFLFNTLSTIQALCRINPEKASETTEKFGTYLRQNLRSMDQPGLIPFEKELEHVRLYADIEMIRFPFIKVEYLIEDDDFSVPALSVQPLVENAIRHGVRIRENGLVTVRSWLDMDAHMISITDNGCGFDVQKALSADKSHIGIRNVKERIEKMCGGTFTINSTPGNGASVIISIPKGMGIV